MKRIVLVEDNEQIMQGNERMLKRRGYEVITALTLAEARSAIEAQIPDLFVLDIMLPDGSGLDFMAELRQHSQVPILLLTGLTTPEDIVRGAMTIFPSPMTLEYYWHGWRRFCAVHSRCPSVFIRAGSALM